MKTYQTTKPAPYGVYASLSPLDMRFVGADGESLEGKAQADYFRVPTGLMLVLAPVAGAVFVVAFPALVLGMTVAAVGNYAAKQVSNVANDSVHFTVARWQPTAAFLRHPGKAPKATEEVKPADAHQGDLVHLEREVQERRDRNS